MHATYISQTIKSTKYFQLYKQFYNEKTLPKKKKLKNHEALKSLSGIFSLQMKIYIPTSYNHFSLSVSRSCLQCKVGEKWDHFPKEKKIH